MSLVPRIVGWLEKQSDWLSPLVVKEVRQNVRGREFTISFSASLVAGLGVAFFGAVDAASGSGTAGRWTFAFLMGCLALLGLGVVPLGAFTALRTERVEQTLDLITLTALSPRRIVIGKLLAQAVKLGTLFAALTPFIAMSFLLGGIDFVTILVAILALFLASVWAGGLGLLLSSLTKARVMSVLVFAAAAGAVVLGFVIVDELMTAARRGVPVFAFLGLGSSVTIPWGAIAAVLGAWLITLINLVLLSAERLSQPTEDSVTPLRIGFFAQLVFAIACALPFLNDPARVRDDVAIVLGAVGTIHLALVAFFALGESFDVPRRALARMREPSRWSWLLATFGPGGGRAAAYVLAQMVLLLGIVSLFQPPVEVLRWFVAASGYICFFTSVPVLLFRRIAPSRVTPFKLRVAVLAVIAASMVLPDLLYYVVSQPEVLDLSLAPRHLISPLRPLAEWNRVEARGWHVPIFMMGATGLLACLALMRMGRVAIAAQHVSGAGAVARAAGAEPPGVS